MSAKIEWTPIADHVHLTCSVPKPAKHYLPEYYQQLDYVNDRTFKFDFFNNTKNINLKNCMPFYDALTQGYIQELHCDVYIEVDQETSNYHYYCDDKNIVAPVGHRDVPSIKHITGFHEIEFLWTMQWYPKTPKGWSVLVTHPLNRIDLPFETISGIIDSDNFFQGSAGNVPFYLKKGFSGIIPAGTPLYQIIPIKREKWQSAKNLFNKDNFISNNARFGKHITNSYKRQSWQRKTFK